MAKFDLDNYETVKQRKLRFYADHEGGRIIVSMVNQKDPSKYALFKATIYLTPEDQAEKLPRATGYALEVREMEKSVSNSGKEYESVNYTSWTENAEESAVGRALDNAGYASNGKPSRDEMSKAQTQAKTFNTTNTTSSDKISPAQLKYVQTLVSATGADRDKIKAVYHVESMNDLTKAQASELIEKLKIKEKEEPEPEAVPKDLLDV